MVTFTAEKRHSSKKDKDYYCVVLHMGTIDCIVAYISKEQYELYVATSQQK